MAPTDPAGRDDYGPGDSRPAKRDESALSGSRTFGSNGLSAPTDVGGYRDGAGVGRSLRALLFFSISMVITFFAVEWLIEGGAYPRHFQQSWAAHFGSTQSFEYGSPADRPFEWIILLKNWDLTIPAALGVAACWHRRRQSSWSMAPVAWLIMMLAVFAIHRPWWSYYYVHIALPLGWCAALGIVWVGEWFRNGRGLGLRVAAALFALCAVSWMGARVYFQAQEIRQSPQLHSALVLDEIERLRPFARYLYADEPVYSFHAGIPMPPALAVLSLKRFWSGEMTNARLVAELEAAQPEILLLRNDPRERPFQDWLADGYRLVYRDGQHLLFARREVARAAGTEPPTRPPTQTPPPVGTFAAGCAHARNALLGTPKQSAGDKSIE